MPVDVQVWPPVLHWLLSSLARFHLWFHTDLFPGFQSGVVLLTSCPTRYIAQIIHRRSQCQWIFLLVPPVGIKPFKTFRNIVHSWSVWTFMECLRLSCIWLKNVSPEPSSRKYRCADLGHLNRIRHQKRLPSFFSAHWRASVHAFHGFLACCFLGYIRLVLYKDIWNGYITLKTSGVMW